MNLFIKRENKLNSTNRIEIYCLIKFLNAIMIKLHNIKILRQLILFRKN